MVKEVSNKIFSLKNYIIRENKYPIYQVEIANNIFLKKRIFRTFSGRYSYRYSYLVFG